MELFVKMRFYGEGSKFHPFNTKNGVPNSYYISDQSNFQKKLKIQKHCLSLMVLNESVVENI